MVRVLSLCFCVRHSSQHLLNEVLQHTGVFVINVFTIIAKHGQLSNSTNLKTITMLTGYRGAADGSCIIAPMTYKQRVSVLMNKPNT